ncbi:MAG: DNA gyrase inhibitor YacG [Planctomycetota bacterium]
MAILVCPTCGREFDSAQTPAMPFCSERCRLIDLGRWLSEEHGMPVDSDPGEESDEFPEDDR